MTNRFFAPLRRPGLALAAALMAWTLALPTAGALAADGEPAGLRHDLSITIDPASARLTATDTVTPPPGFAGSLFLAAEMELTEAVAMPGNRPLVQAREGAWRKLTPPKGAVSLRLAWRGNLPPLDPKRGAAPGAGPDGAFLPAGGGWMPDDFGPTPPSWRLAVEAVGPYVAVASGRLEQEEVGAAGYRGRFAEDRPVEAPSLFIGPWTITERQQDGVRYRAYLHAEQAGLAGGLIDAAAQATARYAAAIGPYPFAGFAIVSAPLPVGLGYPGLTYIGRQVLPLPFVRDRSLAHEVLHNWWGNGVRIVPDKGNWAEGLTTYMADHAVAEMERPAAAAAIRLDWLRDFNALPADRESTLRACRNPRHDAQQVICYGKAAMVFHMLRRELGETAFAAGVQEIWRRWRFRAAAWDDLRVAFESVAGRDLSGFFAQWLDRPGAPSLRLTDIAVDGRKVTLRLSQPGQGGPGQPPPWLLRLPVRIETDMGGENHVINVGQGTDSVALTVGGRPLRVAVDPEHDIFRRMEAGETPLILRDFTLRQQAPAAMPGDATARAAAQAVAAALFSDGVTVINPTTGLAGDGPLTLIGLQKDIEPLTARLGLKPPLSPSARVTGRAWTARTNAGRPVLVLEASDAAALEALSRPLPHYRRESWVTTIGRAVQAHGVWPAGDSVLTRNLETPPR